MIRWCLYEYLRYLRTELALCKASSRRIFTLRRSEDICRAGPFQCYLYLDGNVFLCCFLCFACSLSAPLCCYLIVAAC